jgi:hypothetical protein
MTMGMVMPTSPTLQLRPVGTRGWHRVAGRAGEVVAAEMIALLAIAGLRRGRRVIRTVSHTVPGT